MRFLLKLLTRLKSRRDKFRLAHEVLYDYKADLCDIMESGIAI